MQNIFICTITFLSFKNKQLVFLHITSNQIKQVKVWIRAHRKINIQIKKKNVPFHYMTCFMFLSAFGRIYLKRCTVIVTKVSRTNKEPNWTVAAGTQRYIAIKVIYISYIKHFSLIKNKNKYTSFQNVFN